MFVCLLMCTYNVIRWTIIFFNFLINCYIYNTYIYVSFNWFNKDTFLKFLPRYACVLSAKLSATVNLRSRFAYRIWLMMEKMLRSVVQMYYVHMYTWMLLVVQVPLSKILSDDNIVCMYWNNIYCLNIHFFYTFLIFFIQ